MPTEDDGAVILPFRIIARSRYEPRPNDPAKSCFVEVEGPRLKGMQAAALDEAARFLGEPTRFLYISSNSAGRVVARERWRAHLGIPLRPTRWAVTFTVKLDPLITIERRKNAGLPVPEPAEEEADKNC